MTIARFLGRSFRSGRPLCRTVDALPRMSNRVPFHRGKKRGQEGSVENHHQHLNSKLGPVNTRFSVVADGRCGGTEIPGVPLTSMAKTGTGTGVAALGPEPVPVFSKSTKIPYEVYEM